MKASKRNIRNAIAAAERRSAGPPLVSKYAAKNGQRPPEPKAPASKGID